MLADASTDGLVRLWKVASGKEIRSFQLHDSRVAFMVFAADGKNLFIQSEGKPVSQWDVAKPKEIRQFGKPLQGRVDSVRVSSDGKTIAVIADRINQKSIVTIRLFEVEAGKEIKEIRLNRYELTTDLIFSPNNKALILSGFKHKLLDIDSDKEEAPVPTLPFRPMARSWLCWDSRRIHLQDAATGKEIRQISIPWTRNDSGYSHTVAALSSEGSVLGVVTLDSKDKIVIGLFDVVTGNLVRQVNPVGTYVGPYMQHLGTRLKIFAFSPECRCLAVAGDDGIQLVETASGQERCRFAIKAPTTLAFAPDGRTLVAGDQNGTVYAWDIRTTKELARFEGHGGPVRAVAVAPDANEGVRTVISGSADTSVLVWDGAALRKEGRPQPLNLDAGQVETCWNDLAGDAKSAYQAIKRLAQAGKQAAPFIEEHLKPVRVEEKAILQLVDDLDSNDFEVRNQAAVHLEKLGNLAKPALEQVLKNKPSLEMRQRVDRLLGPLNSGRPPGPEILRALRAIEVLEKLGTLEAKHVLQALAQGVPGADQTAAAQESLKRMRQ